MVAVARTLLKQISILARPPKRSILPGPRRYGRGTTALQGERFKQTIFNGLNQFHLGFDPTSNTSAKVEIEPLNVAYVDFFTLWNGVLGSDPGYQAFGYTNTGWCVNCTWEGCSTNGMCNDPETYFEWIPG